MIAVPIPGELFGISSDRPSSVAVYTDCSAAAVEIRPANKPTVSKALSFMLNYPLKWWLVIPPVLSSLKRKSKNKRKWMEK
jgi:hypothetical protein